MQIKSPNNYRQHDKIKVFLGGSIEMGMAEEWQERLVKEFSDTDVLFVNPRRDDWDSTWEQSIDNPQFNEQVNWELNALEDADIVIFYFDPNTKSPITLMELGLSAASGADIIVCCPPGFWRKGNVDILCDRFYIPVTESYDELVALIREQCDFPTHV